MNVFVLQIKGRDCKVRQMPMIKELKIEKILGFANTVCDIYAYMPEIKNKYPSRSWVCTIGI